MEGKIRKHNDRKRQSLVQLGLFVGIVIFINILANARIGGRALYGYIDMTEEKRFTLTEGTQDLLRNLDDPVTVRVLLEGDFPAGFRRLQTATRDLLDDFRSESAYVEYIFEDPREGSVEQVNARTKQLADQGLNPVNLRVKESGETSQKLIYPYAIVSYRGRSMPVRLLENEVPGVPPEVVLNNSVGLLEYKFSNAIQKLQRAIKPAILFTSGHGELSPLQTADLEKSLDAFYETGRLVLDSVVQVDDEVAVLIIAKPRQPFSDKDQFKIDQYIMRGGKVLWLLDELAVDLDSLRLRTPFLAQPYDLQLDRLLFEYGVRIQPSLVLDLRCTRIPLAVGMVGNAPQFDYFRYPYHLIATPASDHPVVKSLGPVNMLYAATIDTTVQSRTDIRKTPLLFSSANSFFQRPPITMDFDFLRYPLDESRFNKGAQTVALLLEGTFSSLYRNRVTPAMLAGLEELGLEFRTESLPNRMIVVSDGDIARNGINNQNQSYAPLGYNEFERYQFANKEFLLNAIEYLLDSQGVIEARGKEVKLRLLDAPRARAERLRWQMLNIGLPLLFLIVFGLGFNYWRRRRFGSRLEFKD